MPEFRYAGGVWRVYPPFLWRAVLGKLAGANQRELRHKEGASKSQKKLEG